MINVEWFIQNAFSPILGDAKNLNVLKGLVSGARGIIEGFDEGSAGLLIIL